VNSLIDYEEKRIVNNDILSFLKGIGYSDMQFELLYFFSRHPRAKLSLYTIAGTLDAAKIDLRDTIADLVEKGILTAQHNGDSLTTYALTGDRRIQEYINGLANLDWSKTTSLEKQLKLKKKAVYPTNK
jgi:hypothetical protein